jgi:zinc protease
MTQARTRTLDLRPVWQTLLLATAMCLMAFHSGFAATPVDRVTSKRGITAWLVQDHTNPMISVSLVFRNGASADPADKTGLSTFVSGMLDEGAGPYDSQAFQTHLDGHNIQMSFSAGHDAFSGKLQALTTEREEAFDLLRLALTQPRFDADPLARMRNVFLAQLRKRQESPTARAADLMLSSLFKGHPYARSTHGTIDGLNAITADDLHRFVKTRFAKDQLLVSVVGDITPDQLKPLLDTAFGDLPDTANLPQVQDIAPHLDGKIHTLAMPVPQASALFVQTGPARNDPDWHGYQVMMYVLGDGGFSSRLTEEVREKRGLAYGVGASSTPLRHAPLTTGQVGSQTARIGQSLSLIKQEWAKMRDHGPTDAEIAKAKTYLIGSVPLRFNNSASIASTLTTLQYFHLPADELDKRPAVIEALANDEIRAIAKRWLTPDQLTMFVVGEIDKMELPQF